MSVDPCAKMLNGKRLLVLGDNDSDKTHLISRLQGESPCANFIVGTGLEFKYISAKDKYSNIRTTLEAWILDGDAFYQPLLKYAVGENSLASTIVLLVASMTKPWNILSTIASWRDTLKNHIEKLNMPAFEFDKGKSKSSERFNVEPRFGILNMSADEKDLNVNLDVDIVVVITRTECMKEMQTKFGYGAEHLDFIQLNLRKFCLSHGAALFYVSVKEDKNCDILLKYLLHRISSFSFEVPAVLDEPDSIIIPANWDTEKKIKLLSDNISTIKISTPFEDVVYRPHWLCDSKILEPEVAALSDQEFLSKLHTTMEREIAKERTLKKRQEAKKKASDKCSKSEVSIFAKDLSPTPTNEQRNISNPVTAMQSTNYSQELEASQVSKQNDSVLLTYFQSLLNKKTSSLDRKRVGLSKDQTFSTKNSSENLLIHSRQNDDGSYDKKS